MDEPRPSYLQVDLWALEGEGEALDGLRQDREWAAHLRELEREGAVPGWVRDLQRPSTRWRWGVGLLLAATALLAVAVARPVPEPWVGAKGGDGVVVYLDGPEGARPWDGRPMEAGARLRLEIRRIDAPYYAVLHLEQGGEPVVIAAGPLPTDGLVPKAWELGEPAGDRVVVVGLDQPPGSGPAKSLLDRARWREEVVLAPERRP